MDGILNGAMSKQDRLKEKIETVIALINKKLISEENPSKLLLLKKKYTQALNELNTEGYFKTNLLGNIRMYLDSYSDYMNNPLLHILNKERSHIFKMWLVHTEKDGWNIEWENKN